LIAGDLLGERARLTPDKIALVDVSSGRRFSYSALNQWANAFAHLWIAECRLAPGDRVGVLSENRAGYVAAFFAAAKSGVVLVPLNQRLTPTEIAQAIEDAGIRAVFYSKACAETALLIGQQAPEVRWYCIEDVDLERYTEFQAMPRYPEHLWCILYTSGTTGKPKGVMLPHRMVLWNAYNTVASWQLRDDDIASVFTPLCHAGGLAVFLTPLFLIGGTIILHEHFDASAVWRAIERERATLVFGAPSTFKMMRDVPEFETADLARLRWAISGAPLPRYLIDEYSRRGVVFKQGYGLTEAGVNCFALNAAEGARKAGSIGKPMLFAEASIRVSGGVEAPVGETGELWLRGPHVCSGFWNQPDATAAATDRSGWLHTGDLAHADEEGFYYIDGRIKDIFISGGRNVYPAEIENLLLQHPAIEDAAAVGIPHETLGEACVAFVVVRGGTRLTQHEVIRYLEPKLARYKLPREISFVKSLPRTPYGKVLKLELSRWHQDQAPRA
jgi:fatty-acyl-CoA synthase